MLGSLTYSALNFFITSNLYYCRQTDTTLSRFTIDPLPGRTDSLKYTVLSAIEGLKSRRGLCRIPGEYRTSEIVGVGPKIGYRGRVVTRGDNSKNAECCEIGKSLKGQDGVTKRYPNVCVS
jgi:hypothetical protein